MNRGSGNNRGGNTRGGNDRGGGFSGFGRGAGGGGRGYNENQGAGRGQQGGGRGYGGNQGGGGYGGNQGGGGYGGGNRGNYRGGRGDCGGGGGRLFTPGPLKPNPSIIQLGDALIKSPPEQALVETDTPEKQLVRRPDFGKIGRETWIRTNFFQVDLPGTPIFLYEVSFEPAITINRIKKIVHEKLRLHPTFAAIEKHVATDGSQYLVSLKQLTSGATSTKEGRAEDKLSVDVAVDKTTYKVNIERRAEISPSDMHDYLYGKASYYDPGQMIQALNILLAKFPQRQANIVPVGGNKFFLVRNDLQTPLGQGLCARKGFYSSVRPTIGRMLVNVNACSKAFYKTGSLLSLIEEFTGCDTRRGLPQGKLPALRNFLYGLRVKTTYATPWTRPITGVGLKPQEAKFEDQSTGPTKMVTVAAYFKAKYNITLKFPNMPLIEFVNKGKPMCVPAELLEVTEHQPCKDDKLDSGQTGKMITFACKPPSDNAHMITETGLSALGFAGGDGCLNDFAMKVHAEMITVPARILKGPIVRYKASHRDPEPSWNLSNCRFMKSGAEAPKPGQKANWACYIIQDSGRKFDSVIPTLKLFSDVCNKSGLSLGQCSFPMNQNDSIDYSRLGDPAEMAKARGIIESKLKVMASKVRIVLVILDLVRTEPQQHGKPKQTQLKAYGPLYAAVKYAGDVKCGVPTVCCQWDKLNNKMGQQQYMANVAMKFNFKLGGVNHQLSDQNLGLLKDGKAMLVGCDVTHASPKSFKGTPSTAGVVASIDGSYATYPASIRLQEHRVEMITDLKEMMIERLKLWNKKSPNNLWPEHVLVFRDGVSDGEFRKVVDIELPKIKDAFKQCGAPPGYNPKLTLTIVGKRHHTRFFPGRQEDADKTGNPQPGLVVDRGITSVYGFDFFLQPHAGIKGTARPAHYTVLHDENNFTADSLQQLVHNLCYIFQRATKSVSLVPPAYYADILCERGRCYLDGLYNAVSESISGKTKASDDEKAVAMREAKKLWGNGVHSNVKDIMFYL